MFNLKEMQKSAKVLNKSERLIVTRDNAGIYYITDGYIGVKTNETVYKEAFNAVSGNFAILEPGATVSRPAKDRMTEPAPYTDLTRIFTPENNVSSVTMTPYTLDTGKYNCRVFINNETAATVYVDIKRLAAVAPFAGETWQGSEPRKPIYSNSDLPDTAVIALPIAPGNYDYIVTAKSENIEELKNGIMTRDETITEMRAKINALENVLEDYQKEAEKAAEEPQEEPQEEPEKEEEEEPQEEPQEKTSEPIDAAAILQAQNNWMTKQAAAKAAAPAEMEEEPEEEEEPQEEPRGYNPGDIVARYQDGPERLHVVKVNQGFSIYFNVKWNENANDFIYDSGSIRNIPTFAEAKKILKTTRPGAKRIDDYCKNCVTDCTGYIPGVYNGCINKKGPGSPNEKPLTEEQKEAVKLFEKAEKAAKKRAEALQAQAAAGVTIKLPRHARTNYKKLIPFIEATDNNGGAVHFKAGSYMDLVVEKLYYNGPFGGPVYSLAHYGRQNGDMMRDPEMTVEVSACGAIIPLTFQNDYSNFYRQAFVDKQYSRNELVAEDRFLSTWLDNIKAQGFTPENVESIA